jgi:hypothetical protein
VEQRQAVMHFDDAVLVQRVRSALQALYEKHTIMMQLCANLGCEGDAKSDPFESSTLLKEAFQFTYGYARLANDPSVIMMSASDSPMLVMKADFVREPSRLIIQMKCILPDFLSTQTSRTPMSKARWKDLWASEPASMALLEKQLAKLTEQALWAMASDPLPTTSQDPQALDAVLETWMTKHDQEIAKSRESASKAGKKKKRKQKTLHTVHTEECAEEDALRETSDREVDDSLNIDELESKDDVVESAELLEAEETEEADAERADIIVDGQYISYPSVDGYDGDHCFGSCDLRPPRTPPSSPCASRLWEPPQVMNYIWGQTSQEAEPSIKEFVHEPSEIASTKTPASRGSSSQGTPWTRGQWLPFTPDVPGHCCNARVVVRNTFIDLDVKSDCSAAKRSSRSLSPSSCTPKRALQSPPVLAPVEDQWQWYWH